MEACDNNKEIANITKRLFVFIVFISAVVSIQSQDTSSSISATKNAVLKIIKDTVVSVNFGRAVMLESKHLQIQHNTKGAKCQVSVLQNNADASMVVGTLIPSVFPCTFKPNAVYYQHYGSMSRSVEVINLQARVDTEQDTTITPFTLTVSVELYKPFEILKNVENLLVDEIGGLSEPLSTSVINFRYNNKRQNCKVRFLPINNGPPYYGSLVNASVANINALALKYRDISCSDFLKGNIRYVHRRSERSANRDYLPLVIEVYDKKTTKMEIQEYVQVPVRIRRAPDNQPPIVNYNEATYSLQVDQMVLTALTPAVLKVEDRETDPDAIIFNITQVYKEQDGFLVHTDDPSVPVRTFYQKDIEDLKIAFKASDNLSTSQRMQQIWMEARDSYGAKSAPFYIIVVIKPTNSFAPQVIRNEKLTMFEGQSRAITREVLNIRDPDNESEVTIVVTSGLNNGRLEMLGIRVDQFTIKDIDSGSLRYVHDGSDTYTDNIVFRISDGKHTLEILFIILIIPQDDQAPRLKYNTGLTLTEGELKIIDQFHLSATDVDSDDTKVKYQIAKHPSTGSIVYRQSTTPENLNEGWSYIDDNFEKNVSKFYQTDVILGKIFYRHSGNEQFHDYFTLYLLDEVPNRSGLKTFIINIKSVDDLPPVLQDDCTLTLRTEEGTPVAFSKQTLSYTDGDSIDPELTYKITRQPYFLHLSTSRTRAGKIVAAHDHSKEIQDFTQRHVNYFKVHFIPSNVEIGNLSKTILFHFDVTDGNGNAIRNQTFQILVSPVNNKPPTFITSLLIVQQGGRKNITTSYLNAYDKDTNSSDVSFLLKRQPKQGIVVYKGSKLQLGGAVQFVDISQGHLQYVHDGIETGNDDIKFMLSDQRHMGPATLQIEILPVKSNIVAISLLQKKLSVQENGIVEITQRTIEVSEDSDDVGKLAIKVVDKPQHGIIEKEGSPTDTFTWSDIAAGKIAYRHTSGEIGIINVSDNVSFTLANTSKEIVVDGKLYGGLSLDINIMSVDSQPPVLHEPAIISVKEGGRTSLSINITDKDTDLSHVTCVVTRQPVYGFLENVTPLAGSEVKQNNIRVTDFTAEEAQLRNVNYVQSKHQRIEPTADSFDVRCSDGNNTSPVVTVHVAIAPVNDESPIIFVQDPITCVEDDLVLFDLSKINPFDRDLPKDVLTITVVQQPVNGELMLQKVTGIEVAKTFTLADLSGTGQTTIMYQHKGTETRSDTFILSVGDGKHTVNKTININIIPMDDERPQLIVNTGLHIERGETKIITSRNLKAHDLDSNDSQLLYIVMMESIFGKLQNRIGDGEYEDLNRGSNFTQDDIDKKRIRYLHLNPKGGERDSVRLDVTDGLNRLINQIFHIIIASEDIILLEVVNKGIELPENSRKILTTDMLSASDLNSPDETLAFIVTKTPLRGYLEHASYDGIPLTRFTQLDLASNKISYVHTSDDELKTDHFEFEVTDGENKVFRTFRIKILSVDNKKPVLETSSELLAYEGQDKIITPFELSAFDNDTSTDKIVFSVHRPPKYGIIVFGGKTQTHRFTQHDIENNRIAYRNLQKSKELVDKFAVTVSDGTHAEFFYPAGTIRKDPVNVSIKIKISDRKAPVLMTNNGGSILHSRHSRTFFRFSVEALEAVDLHAPAESVTYLVTSFPREGRLVNVIDKQTPITRFTQQDINKRSVEYVLNKDSNATRDVFLFDITDTSNNTLREQSFNFYWARVCATTYYDSALETDGTIEVSFKRYGNLKNVGFSTVDIRNLDKHKGVREKEELLHWRAGSRYTSLNLTIIDNEVYEKTKKVMLSLRDGVNVLIGQQCNMHVDISDPEDEPTVFMATSSMKISESIGTLEIPIKRRGDIRDITSVYCITNSGSALGSGVKGVLSFHDYISRNKDEKSSLVTFEENESVRLCRITILDDTIYEDDETFQVQLLPHFGGRIGTQFQNTSVLIESDPNDEPVLLLEKNLYTVQENEGFVRIIVRRRSEDLNLHSYVQIATQQMFPLSAEANKDYRPVAKALEFYPGKSFIEVAIEIIDDLYRPRMEGRETFAVVLHSPRNGRLDESSSKAIVGIEDLDLDKPTVYFKETTIRVDEDAGTVTIPIMRTGDPLKEVSVRCYTRQRSATVSQDFIERKRDEESVIKFGRKETENECKIQIIDDGIFEGDESFDVFLEIQPHKDMLAEVLQPNHSVITIVDNDEPVAQFSQKKYFAFEPTAQQGQTTVRITILRTGDQSKQSRVTVISKDGSALAGIHYKPIAKSLVFESNTSDVSLNVTLYHVPSISVRLAFTLLLATDVEDPVTKVTNERAVISIEEKTLFSNSATFPLNPIVVSLADYGEIRNARKHPINGYPLVCVTACDPRYSNYKKTKAICEQEMIANKKTIYRWQIKSSVNGGSTAKFQDITSSIFLTKTNSITLDSVHFGALSRVRCIAKAYSTDGGFGAESTSEAVIISASSEGLCRPRTDTTKHGSTPFSAQASYVTRKDEQHKNMVHIKLLIPHQDGMLPIISTKKLSNFDLILSPDVTRTTQHACSNLLNYNELSTKFGFLTSLSRSTVYSSQPFQHDNQVRGNKTVNFYQHLNLDSCLWTFESYYDINELVTKCGADMVTDGQVQNAVQSSLTIRIPLFVTYLYRNHNGNPNSGGGDGGFVSYKHQSSIRLTAVYDTGALWGKGIELLSNGKLTGELYPTSIIVMQKDRRLLLKFKTKARFRGVFLQATKDGKLISQASSADHPSLTFTLKHIESEHTYNEPLQEWHMTSDMAVRDYSGTYAFKLIPCVVGTEIKEFTWPPATCTPDDFVQFELPLSIHQTSQPVDTTFTLNTLFFVLKDPQQLLEPPIESNQVSPNDVAFEEGDIIYGRVLIDRASSIAKAYRLKLEKVFVCTGKDGYIPEFDPNKKHYGCLLESDSLRHRLKILDRSDPDTQDVEFWKTPFNATFLSNDLRDHHTDGFSLDSSPLFKDTNGRTWFLHVIYKVRAKKKRRAKRGTTEGDSTIHGFLTVGDSLSSTSAVNKRAKRSLDPRNQQLTGSSSRELRAIGHKKGTNLKMLTLRSPASQQQTVLSSTVEDERTSTSQRSSSSAAADKSKNLLIAVITGVSAFLLIVVFIVVVYRKRHVKASASGVDTAGANSNNNNGNT